MRRDWSASSDRGRIKRFLLWMKILKIFGQASWYGPVERLLGGVGVRYHSCNSCEWNVRFRRAIQTVHERMAQQCSIPSAREPRKWYFRFHLSLPIAIFSPSRRTFCQWIERTKWECCEKLGRQFVEISSDEVGNLRKKWWEIFFFENDWRAAPNNFNQCYVINNFHLEIRRPLSETWCS